MIAILPALRHILRESPRLAGGAMSPAAQRTGSRHGRRVARQACAGRLNLGRLLAQSALPAPVASGKHETGETSATTRPASDRAAAPPATGAGRERARRSPVRRPAARRGAKKSSPAGPGPGGEPAPSGALVEHDLNHPAAAHAPAGFGVRPRRMRVFHSPTKGD